MKKLFVSQSLVEVESLREVLEGAGIPCMLKNRQGASLAGEVPFAEVFPELWVNDADYDEAHALLSDRTAPPSRPGVWWTCSACGEQHTAQFTACWKCGRQRSADT